MTGIVCRFEFSKLTLQIMLVGAISAGDFTMQEGVSLW